MVNVQAGKRCHFYRQFIVCLNINSYARVMINIISKCFLMFLMVTIPAVNAAIYKGIDSDGNVFFSDQPFENAEAFTPSAISVVDSALAKLEKDVAEKEPTQFKYTKFDIVSPLPNQVVRNQSDISVSLQIAPPLNIGLGHKVWLLMDGKPVVKNSQSMSLQVGLVDRGAHIFQAQIREADGKIIARTRTTVVHVKRTSR